MRAAKPRPSTSSPLTSALLLNPSQNDFIVKMNEELFRPRGLYCLIMAYRPDTGKTVPRQGTLTQINIDAATGTHASANNRYRSNDGTMGPIEFPASADLIFPGLEDASRDNTQGEGSMGDSFLKAFERFKNRRDLKAQRKYVMSYGIVRGVPN